MRAMNQRLLRIFDRLLAAFGKRHWWPGDTPLEIMVGAVLTQNTAWKNVERAIANMKRAGIMDLQRLFEIDVDALAEIIRPAGFFNIKSKRLKNLIRVICEKFNGSIDTMGSIEPARLRQLLLDVDGIGYETADSILLYALEKPIFVVDAYTKRFLNHHRLYDGNGDYTATQEFFMDNLPSDTYLFNEFHALIVALCQHYCKKIPVCRGCPLEHERGL